jgi:hypothetical protein
MDAVRLTVSPKLRSHIIRFFIVILGLFYSFKALYSIPEKGFYIYQLWIPKSLWLKKLLLPLLKYNISLSNLQSGLYVYNWIINGLCSLLYPSNED